MNTMTPLDCALSAVIERPSASIHPEAKRATLEQLAFQYGQSYDSYLSTEGNLKQFWCSTQQSVIAYAQRGRYLHVQGGLLGPLVERQQLLHEFANFVRENRQTATFYNIGESDLAFFEESGFQITKWGEDPVLDLPDLSWTGHDFEWVRRQSNFCRRQNLIVSEICIDGCSAESWQQVMTEICSIANDCLASKPQRSEVQFFNGQVNPPEWDRRGLFVARSDNGNGRIEGFLICLPYDAGKQWAIDTYRHRSDAPKGVVPYLIRETADRLKAEGIKAISLCLCPAAGYEKLNNDSWMIRRGLQFGYHYASAFFDVPGEYHFKSRFRPRFVRRFICHSPGASFGSIFSTIALSAALDLDYRRFASKLVTRILRPARRRSLATPKPTEPMAVTVKATKKSRSKARSAIGVQS